jgi:hypothetical protein
MICKKIPALIALAAGMSAGIPLAWAGELPITRIPHEGAGAEFYFGPDNVTLVGNAKLPDASIPARW